MGECSSNEYQIDIKMYPFSVRDRNISLEIRIYIYNR